MAGTHLGRGLLLVGWALVLAPAALRAETAAPDRDEFMRSLRAAEEAVLQEERVAREEQQRNDPETAPIAKILDETKIDLDFTDAALEDVVGFIREYARINIEIDQRVRELGLAEKKTTVNLKAVSVRSALKTVLGAYGLSFLFDRSVLLIVEAASAEELPRTSAREPHGVVELPVPEGTSPDEADRVRETLKKTRFTLCD